jgi:hypothetical protein
MGIKQSRAHKYNMVKTNSPVKKKSTIYYINAMGDTIPL